MTELNFPKYRVLIKNKEEKTLIFDSIRKKYVMLTPEEWVRQHLINYLVTEKKYPASLISVEMPLKYVRLNKRSDVVVFDCNGNPLMIAECKAPEVKITQSVFDQIFIYNGTIKTACLMVTNGLQHYCISIFPDGKPNQFLKEIPSYEELKGLCIKE